jgi:hypothetical protein
MKTRQITAWVVASVLMSTVFTSCKKEDTPSLPPIGGYNSSNDVAATNLLAHWTFDGTNNERISGTAPSTGSNNTFTTGIKGQALQLNSGYVLYPTVSALNTANAIPSVTVSAWVNTANNGKTATSLFALTQALTAQSDWNQGPINMYIDANAHPATSDTLQLHSAFHTYLNGNYSTGGDNVTGFGLADAGKKYQVVKGSGKWVHYVMVYDGAGSNIDLYANGVLVSNSDYRSRTVNGTGIGNIVLSSPTQVLIGGWPNAATGYTKSTTQAWQGLFTGSIDELRVFNKALSVTDIGSLYQLEQAGR